MCVYYRKKYTMLNKKIIDQTLKGQGRIFIQGTNIMQFSELEEYASLLVNEPMEYKFGSAVRYKKSDNVHTKSSYCASKILPQHQEMFYAAIFPGRIAFYCKSPASLGGEMIITDMSKLTQSLPEHFLKKLQKNQVVFVNFFKTTCDHYSSLNIKKWSEAFGTDDKEIIAKLSKNYKYDMEWIENGEILKLSYKMPNFHYHNIIKKQIFFSSILIYQTAKRFTEEEKTFISIFRKRWV